MQKCPKIIAVNSFSNPSPVSSIRDQRWHTTLSIRSLASLGLGPRTLVLPTPSHHPLSVSLSNWPWLMFENPSFLRTFESPQVLHRYRSSGIKTWRPDDGVKWGASHSFLMEKDTGSVFKSDLMRAPGIQNRYPLLLIHTFCANCCNFELQYYLSIDVDAVMSHAEKLKTNSLNALYPDLEQHFSDF